MDPFHRCANHLCALLFVLNHFHRMVSIGWHQNQSVLWLFFALMWPHFSMAIADVAVDDVSILLNVFGRGMMSKHLNSRCLQPCYLSVCDDSFVRCQIRATNNTSLFFWFYFFPFISNSVVSFLSAVGLDGTIRTITDKLTSVRMLCSCSDNLKMHKEIKWNWKLDNSFFYNRNT